MYVRLLLLNLHAKFLCSAYVCAIVLSLLFTESHLYSHRVCNMMLTQRISTLASDLAKQCHVSSIRVGEKTARERLIMNDKCRGEGTCTGF